MPTYEYECLKCNHRFEVMQSITDEPLRVCPECGGKVRRLIHGGMGIIFKGSGFYSTDNRNGSRKGGGESGPAPDKAASSSGSSAAGDASSSSDSAKKDTAKPKGHA